MLKLKSIFKRPLFIYIINNIEWDHFFMKEYFYECTGNTFADTCIHQVCSIYSSWLSGMCKSSFKHRCRSWRRSERRQRERDTTQSVWEIHEREKVLRRDQKVVSSASRVLSSRRSFSLRDRFNAPGIAKVFVFQRAVAFFSVTRNPLLSRDMNYHFYDIYVTFILNVEQAKERKREVIEWRTIGNIVLQVAKID